jgi:sugar-specific transcriptional regulator TrmB
VNVAAMVTVKLCLLPLKITFQKSSIFFRFHTQKDEVHLSKEWMLKTLENLGLKHLDAEVYVYLAQSNPQKARDIAEALETYKQQLYRSLRKLQRKGMVSASQERPARFSAVSFDKVLDLFIKNNREEAQRIEESKEQILSMWRSKILGNFKD